MNVLRQGGGKRSKRGLERVVLVELFDQAYRKIILFSNKDLT